MFPCQDNGNASRRGFRSEWEKKLRLNDANCFTDGFGLVRSVAEINITERNPLPKDRFPSGFDRNFLSSGIPADPGAAPVVEPEHRERRGRLSKQTGISFGKTFQFGGKPLLFLRDPSG